MMTYYGASRAMYGVAAALFVIAFFVAFGWGGVFILAAIGATALGLRFDDLHYAQTRKQD